MNLPQSIGFALILALSASTATHVPGRMPTVVTPTDSLVPGEVTGLVYDSTSNAPLQGAVVQIASENSTVVPFSDTTDAAGHFRFNGLPAGRYIIGFEHDLLQVYHLESPLRAVRVADSTDLFIDLSIPPAADVYSARCRSDSTSGQSGLIAGLIHNAESSEPVADAVVTVTWQAIVLDPKRIRTEQQRVESRTAANGSYLLCGVPLGAPVNIEVKAPSFHTVAGRVETAEVEASRRDFLLSDSSQVKGTTTLNAKALDDNGKRVQSGHVTISALGIDVPINQGQFVISDVPAGTWSLDLRAIGFEPKTELVTIGESPDQARTFALSKRPHTLDVVSVVGTPGRATTILTDILRRHRTTGGTIFLPGNPALESVMFPSELYNHRTRGAMKRLIGNQGGACPPSAGIAPTPRQGGAGAGPVPKSLAVYLNGERFWLGFESLNHFIAMRDVLAVESYSDVLFAPVEWRTNDACAVFVLWTKQ